jgi:hypothetical protein
VEGPGLRPEDALLQAIAAWDALACARRDGAADALYLGLHPQRADGVEKLADRARDDQGLDACRRLELPAVPEAARRGLAPCTQAVDLFAERSFAAPVAAGSDALEPKRQKAQKWKLKQVLKACVSMEAAQPDVPAARLPEWMLPGQQ